MSPKYQENGIRIAAIVAQEDSMYPQDLMNRWLVAAEVADRTGQAETARLYRKLATRIRIALCIGPSQSPAANAAPSTRAQFTIC
jgi:hypothetical protein